MSSPVTVTRIESIPSEASVRHVDELSDRTRERLYQIVFTEPWTSVESPVATELTQYDMIKFTDYYCITPSGAAAS